MVTLNQQVTVAGELVTIRPIRASDRAMPDDAQQVIYSLDVSAPTVHQPAS